jgi:hypothetical protein
VPIAWLPCENLKRMRRDAHLCVRASGVVNQDLGLMKRLIRSVGAMVSVASAALLFLSGCGAAERSANRQAPH